MGDDGRCVDDSTSSLRSPHRGRANPRFSTTIRVTMKVSEGGGGHSNIIIRYRYVYVCVSYITSCNAMFTVHMFCLADEKN